MRFAPDQFPRTSDGHAVTANAMRFCRLRPSGPAGAVGPLSRKRKETRLCFTDRLQKHRPTAFTFVELCFGLIITALVMAGLAAFSLAMCTAWQNAGSSEATLLAANQDIRLLDAKIRPCGLTGGWQAGSLDGTAQPPAAVLLWTADNNNSSTINYSEIMLIEHDPQAQQIKLYRAPTALTVPDAVSSYANLFSQASFISTFKDGLTPTVLCGNVVGARFYVGPANNASARPFVEFALTIQAGNQTRVVYGDAALRAPLAVPMN